VSGLTLSNTGSVTYYDDKYVKPYIILRRRLAGGEQSLINNIDNPLIWNQVLDSRGALFINFSSVVNTTFPYSAVSASVPNYNLFTFPVAGMYEFKLALTVNNSPNAVIISLSKNFKQLYSHSAGKPTGYWTGEVFTCTAYMTPLDTAFFSANPNTDTVTGSENLNGLSTHWCSVKLLE